MSDDNSFANLEAQPIRDGSPLMAFLFIVRKAHREMAGAEFAHARFQEVRTHGHAKAYLEEIMPLLIEHRRARRHGPAS